MDARFIGFGAIEIEGKRYDHDLVIEGGQIHKRSKKASKAFRDRYGHTPLAAAEHIPWGGGLLIIGTGAYGKLPVMPDVLDEARRRRVEVVAEPTGRAVERLRALPAADVHAILHITC